MANTERLKHEVEDFVRGELSTKFGVKFEKQLIPLMRVHPPRGRHEFDAVAEDHSIIAGVISSAPKTSGGRRNVGAVHHATGELYYLTLVNARHRILVSTDPGFHELMRSVTEGRLAAGLELLHIQLSSGLEKLVRQTRLAASREMSHREANTRPSA